LPTNSNSRARRPVPKKVPKELQRLIDFANRIEPDDFRISAKPGELTLSELAAGALRTLGRLR
jgi:hypothetical protein